MQWYNEPPQWHAQGSRLMVTAAPNTDFWRITHHGYITDNAHFYYQDATGDFTAQVAFTADYNTLYDQAGLMLRLDEKTWIKCGVEYVDGRANAAVVVTREFSDFSVARLSKNLNTFWIRLRRIGDAVLVYYSLDGQDFIMLREAYFSDAPTAQIGVMCAAPRGAGFTVAFSDFVVEA